MSSPDRLQSPLARWRTTLVSLAIGAGLIGSSLTGYVAIHSAWQRAEAKQLKKEFALQAASKARAGEELTAQEIAALKLSPRSSLNNVLNADTKRILDTGDRFVLLSIDPNSAVSFQSEWPGRDGEVNSPATETFHRYDVLGKTEIVDQGHRKALVDALCKGIAESYRMVAACFIPRHGIRATLGNETVELVICFECSQVEVHAKHEQYLYITTSPRPVFNHALEKAGLPIAPPSCP